MPDTAVTVRRWTAAEVRQHLLDRREIALLDVREEDPYAQGHPLWAANLPLSRLELDAWTRLPRLDVPIVVYGRYRDRDLAPVAAARLDALGYTEVFILDGGLEAWVAAGGEVFRDVNVPSKAFGELVESVRHTPSLSAEEVAAQLGDHPPVVVDVRRSDEYQTMSIPTAVSVPGGEVVLRIRDLVPDPQTPIVVNCAGRTRSIIGTQSLINAGVPNPVVALRNGTIGWTLAGQELDHGAALATPASVSPEHREAARAGARAIADRAGVQYIHPDRLAVLDDPARTVLRLDVRTEQEYAAGHLAGFRHAPGGQLVQETDHTSPVRGARLVLADDDGVRAPMTASWLAQMGWDVWVVEPGGHFTETGPEKRSRPAAPVVDQLTAAELAESNGRPGTLVIDVGPSREYERGHVPGAWFAVRAQLADAAAGLAAADRLVVTSPDGELARWAVADLADVTRVPVYALAGGTHAWRDSGAPLERGAARLLTPPSDRYRRPYEGTGNAVEAMQAYLDWEYGLVDQLERDGTHFFTVA